MTTYNTVASPFQGFSHASNRGSAMLALGHGLIRPVKAIGTLRVEANVVDDETVVIGDVTYEINSIATDSTVDTSGGTLNNTTDPVTGVLWAAHGLAVNDYVACQSEVMRVTVVEDAGTLTLSRGHFGTTAATHADAENLLTGAGPTIAINTIEVPLATLTPAVATDALILAINANTVHQVTAIDVDANEVLLVADNQSANDLVLSETLTGVDNTIDATLRDGVDIGTPVMAVISRTPTAAEVATGNLHVPLDFTPVGVLIDVRVTSTGVALAWDGVDTLDTTNNVITLDNSGTADWAATHTVNVLAFGAHVAVPNTTANV